MKLILPDIWKSNENEENMKDKEKDLDLLANAVLSVKIFTYVHEYLSHRKSTSFQENFSTFGSSLWS